MEIISDINHQTLPPSVATIGFFDGVHRGHRFLINQVKEVAAKDGLYSALITFPVHPRQVIQTAYRPQLLSSPTEKLELLETMQVDYCFLLPFTQELSLFSAREFMRAPPPLPLSPDSPCDGRRRLSSARTAGWRCPVPGCQAAADPASHNPASAHEAG